MELGFLRKQIAFWRERSRHGIRHILFVVATLSLAGCVGLESFLAPTPTPLPPPTPTPFPTPAPVTPAALALPDQVPAIDEAGLDFAERRVIDVYNRVAPSVVTITTKILRRGFFFEVIPEEGAGSGFVLDKQGHILTNFHVVEGAQNIEVTFEGDLVFTAEVVGLDPRNDVAVLQIDAPADLLTPVELGSSSSLQVGQRAIAIGNPFGQFSRTLTTGVISALDRTLEGQDGRLISGVIQTDAAINRGNSGGPLLDSSGRVIGINTAIFSPSGTSSGVGFAVPVDTIKRVLPDLLTLGRYRHPYLGIRYAYRISPGLADALDLPVKKGLLLVQLYDGSPLDKMKVRGAQREAILGNQRVYIGGDILVAVDGHEITSMDELQMLLESNYRVGDTVTVDLIRDGQQFSVNVTLDEEPQG
jgi:S1-C subfamily serine protease